MTVEISPTPLVSPLSRSPLFKKGNLLVTADQSESYPFERDIEKLIDHNLADNALRHEKEIFDNLPIQGLSYFRPQLYQYMLKKLQRHIRDDRHADPERATHRQDTDLILKQGDLIRCAELGGGEGHCAQYLKDYYRPAEVCVCDVSTAALQRAPDSLRRICADITMPIFSSGVLQIAAFWVSLHHIPADRRRMALEEAYKALADGGVLIVFEPSTAFFLRRMLYRSSLRHDVYFDEQECAVEFSELVDMARDVGFEEAETIYLNPPYNTEFVRRLKRWWLYLFVVQLLTFAGFILGRWQNRTHTSALRYVTLYGMSFFKKPAKLF